MKRFMAAIILSLLLGTLAQAEGTLTEAPSAWSGPELAQALEFRLVPAQLQSDYQQEMTRAEFTQTAFHFVLAQFNYDEDYFILNVPYYDADGNRVKPNYDVFTDCSTTAVVWCNTLGIVQGRGDGTFGPDDPITRQEAAAMLGRTYAVYGGAADTAPDIRSFTDQAGVAEWARESVALMVAWNVMQGMGDGTFAPEGYYTREQCFLTMLRLYQNAPVSRHKKNVTPLVPYETEIDQILNSYPLYHVIYREDTEDYTILYGYIGGLPTIRPNQLQIIARHGGVRIPALSDGSIPQPANAYKNFQLSEDGLELSFQAGENFYRCDLYTAGLYEL